MKYHLGSNTLLKRIFLFLIVFITFAISVNADILPATKSDIENEVIGLYQVPLRFYLYATPSKKADIVYQANWDYKTFNSTSGSAEDLFTVFIQSKELAYVKVTDYNDEWTEVIYNKEKNLRGWLPTEEFRFMTWRSFYNIYGRKYGLYFLKDAPKSVKELHGSTTDDSPVIQRIDNPKKVKLTVIKGNWALITSIENNIGKTGYMRWRNDEGEIYAFPAIK